MILALLWSGALVLGFWNYHSADRIAWSQQVGSKNAAVEAFLANQAEFHERLEERLGQLAQEVENPKFGLLFLEQDLERLAGQSRLAALKVDALPGKVSRGEIPVKVSFDGTLGGAVDWLARIEKDLPYLEVIRFEGRREEERGTAAFSVMLNYRYRINPAIAKRS